MPAFAYVSNPEEGTKTLRTEKYEVPSGFCKACSACSKKSLDGKLLRCAGCNMAWYCNRECQKKDWKGHKLQCKFFANKPISSIRIDPKVLVDTNFKADVRAWISAHGELFDTVLLDNLPDADFKDFLIAITKYKPNTANKASCLEVIGGMTYDREQMASTFGGLVSASEIVKQMEREEKKAKKVGGQGMMLLLMVLRENIQAISYAHCYTMHLEKRTEIDPTAGVFEMGWGESIPLWAKKMNDIASKGMVLVNGERTAWTKKMSP